MLIIFKTALPHGKYKGEGGASHAVSAYWINYRDFFFNFNCYSVCTIAAFIRNLVGVSRTSDGEKFWRCLLPQGTTGYVSCIWLSGNLLTWIHYIIKYYIITYSWKDIVLIQFFILFLVSIVFLFHYQRVMTKLCFEVLNICIIFMLNIFIICFVVVHYVNIRYSW